MYGKGSSPRNIFSEDFRSNYDSMTVDIEWARQHCASPTGYVTYVGEQGMLYLKLDDRGTCGFWGNTYFKTGPRMSRVRKQMTSNGHTVVLVKSNGEPVA
jgi:hypothetical protein